MTIEEFICQDTIVGDTTNLDVATISFLNDTLAARSLRIPKNKVSVEKGKIRKFWEKNSGNSYWLLYTSAEFIYKLPSSAEENRHTFLRTNSVRTRVFENFSQLWDAQDVLP